LEAEFYCLKCEKYYTDTYKFCPKHGEKLIRKESVQKIQPDQPDDKKSAQATPVESKQSAAIEVTNDLTTPGQADRVKQLEEEIISLKSQLAESEILVRQETSKSKDSNTRTSTSRRNKRLTVGRIFAFILITLVFAWGIHFALYHSQILQPYPWLNNYIIQISNLFHYRFEVYFSNNSNQWLRSHLIIFFISNFLFSFLWIFLPIYVIFTDRIFLKDKPVRLFTVFWSCVAFILCLILVVSIVEWKGVWEILWPNNIFYLNWPLEISGVIIFITFISAVFILDKKKNDKPRCSKLIMIFLMILLLGYLLESIYFANQTTTRSIDISSDRGWQTSGLSIA
jgi:hypothetical protein